MWFGVPFGVTGPSAGIMICWCSVGLLCAFFCGCFLLAIAASSYIEGIGINGMLKIVVYESVFPVVTVVVCPSLCRISTGLLLSSFSLRWMSSLDW